MRAVALPYRATPLACGGEGTNELEDLQALGEGRPAAKAAGGVTSPSGTTEVVP